MQHGFQVDREGDVLHIRLTSPGRRNALTREVLVGIRQTISTSTEAGIVLSGQDGFSAGADLSEIEGSSADAGFDELVAALTESIRTHPRIVIAAIEGPCVGAAVDIALSCDIRIAAKESFFQMPAAQLGVLYNPASLDSLETAFPGEPLRRLFLLGERIDAETAVGWHLASELVEEGEAERRAFKLLERSTDDALEAVAATKAFFNARNDPGRIGAFQGARRTLLDSPARKESLTSKKASLGLSHGPSANAPDKPPS